MIGTAGASQCSVEYAVTMSADPEELIPVLHASQSVSELGWKCGLDFSPFTKSHSEVEVQVTMASLYSYHVI